MAKVTIAGDAVVVKSGIKFEDLKTIKKYRPAALTLRGGEDGKQPIFTISVRENGDGGINENGATFGAATRDEEKLATFTMIITASADADVKNLVIDEIGGYLANLNKLEATLPAVIDEIKAERDAVAEAITVA
jgi:hypothetical protein